VLHFAAFAYVGESVSDPAKYYDDNVAGTLALLAGMRTAGCDALVFSSTCAVYGQPTQVPIVEDTRPDPVNPYGASKLMVERILADFRPAYGLRSMVLRYFNACGAERRTAPPSAITYTSLTWLMRMSPRWSSCSAARPAVPSTSARDVDTRLRTSCTRSSAKQANPCRT
jgi:UDP-glucose 4-epimerase